MTVKLETGHFMSTVKVGPKGQIVIPKEVRDMFGIEPGQSLVIMADPDRGIALQRQEVLSQIADAIFSGQKPADVTADTNPEHLNIYAQAIKKTIEEDKK